MKSKYTIVSRNMDGNGSKPVRCYATPVAPEAHPGYREYWPAVTDVPCPCCDGGTIRWAENLYAAGYRICDKCGRHFMAGGTAEAPTLLRVGDRRSSV